MTSAANWVPVPVDEKGWDELLDYIYDEGYDDALAGRPRRWAADVQEDYDAGYTDGQADR